MLTSAIRIHGSNPILYIDGQPTAAMAYTTYFEERSRYEDFIDAGYRIFFVNISFTKAPINNFTGFTPFRVGVFEDPSRPDYSEFETAVQKILEKCPDAVIFPRIYASMPRWWTESHPDSCISTPKGGVREALFSEAFRQDGSQLLTELIRHIRSAHYAHRIGGWMLCGGQTQEWFHHDSHGSLGVTAETPFLRWMQAQFGVEGAALPRPEDYISDGRTRQDSENARRYARFCNLEVAKTIEHFARVIKNETAHSQVVGAFYGYAYQCNGTPLFGTHGLWSLLDSEDLDFFSAPNAYSNDRAFGIDWADMIPVDSLKCHGKLAFIECDIRTHLTTGVQRARPGEYPGDIYGDALWKGPPTAELSRYALQKCFCHQLTKASAIWWFDMWGGWYDDPLLMEALTQMKRLYDDSLPDNAPLSPEVVFFADESGFAGMLIDSPQIKAVSRTRTNMGTVGVPNNTFLVEDAERALAGCKAAIFPFPVPSEAGKRAMALCEERGIPYLTATETHCELTTGEIRDFLRESGVHFYTDENDVAYAGNGYLALHSAVGGTKKLKLPGTFRIRPVFGAEIPEQVTDDLVFDLPENGTALFSVHAP